MREILELLETSKHLMLNRQKHSEKMHVLNFEINVVQSERVENRRCMTLVHHWPCGTKHNIQYQTKIFKNSKS